ncbi:hypothetical protein BpHYR1_004753 [Brachionus plicatilis]|uniref:Uncharacterized protein n=1 Tax=Brachionus plicatilis TaxID=10195 RepID=A0A3M7PMP2_BRAPC|nr:hypothetical protein BpHYR1_004753 [Brachionus plicatilis]
MYPITPFNQNINELIKSFYISNLSFNLKPIFIHGLKFKTFRIFIYQSCQTLIVKPEEET